MGLTIGAAAGKIVGDVGNKIDKNNRIGKQVGQQQQPPVRKGLDGIQDPTAETKKLDDTRRRLRKDPEPNDFDTFVMWLRKTDENGVAKVVDTKKVVLLFTQKAKICRIRKIYQRHKIQNGSIWKKTFQVCLFYESPPL